MFTEDLLIDLVRFQLAALDLVEECAEGVDDFLAAAVGDAEVQAVGVEVPCCALDKLLGGDDLARQHLGASQDAHPDAVAEDARIGCHLGELLREQAHEGSDLIIAAIEVLRGEGVEGHRLDADLAAPVRQRLDGSRAQFMALPGQTLEGPGVASIAVHDEAHMSGDRTPAHFRGEAPGVGAVQDIAHALGQPAGNEMPRHGMTVRRYDARMKTVLIVVGVLVLVAGGCVALCTWNVLGMKKKLEPVVEAYLVEADRLARQAAEAPAGTQVDWRSLEASTHPDLWDAAKSGLDLPQLFRRIHRQFGAYKGKRKTVGVSFADNEKGEFGTLKVISDYERGAMSYELQWEAVGEAWRLVAFKSAEAKGSGGTESPAADSPSSTPGVAEPATPEPAGAGK